MLRYLSTPTLKSTKSFSYFVLSKNFSKYFVKSHEWIQVEKGVATVGISDYAQSELGEIVHVDLPKVGDKFKSGESLGAVESVKTAADIYSPIEGIVGEVNDKLSKTPSLLNTHAETLGDWGLGIWGLGIGPNPQSPIPNPHPQSPKMYL
jgi:glycine cleavage system H protein